LFSLTTNTLAEPLELTVHTDQTTKTISVGIYGQFLEHIFNSVHRGLWGDQILNGTLELRSPRRRRGSMPGRDASPTPQYWEFIGDSSDVAIDQENPLNAEISVRMAPRIGEDSSIGLGIRQQNIALAGGEKYTLSLYARGSGAVIVTFYDGDASVFSKTFTGLTVQWQRFTVDYVEDPYKYEQFLKGRGEIIQKSGNPNMKIYVSEWNLTEKEWGNDWRVGLYAGGILNAFERQGDIVTMSCPALFMRRQGMTTSWDNALINFDQKSWF
jgi:hypothetical protein